MNNPNQLRRKPIGPYETLIQCEFNKSHSELFTLLDKLISNTPVWKLSDILSGATPTPFTEYETQSVRDSLRISVGDALDTVNELCMAYGIDVVVERGSSETTVTPKLGNFKTYYPSNPKANTTVLNIERSFEYMWECTVMIDGVLIRVNSDRVDVLTAIARAFITYKVRLRSDEFFNKYVEEMGGSYTIAVTRQLSSRGSDKSTEPDLLSNTEPVLGSSRVTQSLQDFRTDAGTVSVGDQSAPTVLQSGALYSGNEYIPGHIEPDDLEEFVEGDSIENVNFLPGFDSESMQSHHTKSIEPDTPRSRELIHRSANELDYVLDADPELVVTEPHDSGTFVATPSNPIDMLPIMPAKPKYYRSASGLTLSPGSSTSVTSREEASSPTFSGSGSGTSGVTRISHKLDLLRTRVTNRFDPQWFDYEYQNHVFDVCMALTCEMYSTESDDMSNDVLKEKFKKDFKNLSAHRSFVAANPGYKYKPMHTRVCCGVLMNSELILPTHAVNAHAAFYLGHTSNKVAARSFALLGDKCVTPFTTKHAHGVALRDEPMRPGDEVTLVYKYKEVLCMLTQVYVYDRANDDTLIVTATVRIDPGVSGAAVFDKQSRLVGIVSAKDKLGDSEVIRVSIFNRASIDIRPLFRDAYFEGGIKSSRCSPHDSMAFVVTKEALTSVGKHISSKDAREFKNIVIPIAVGRDRRRYIGYLHGRDNRLWAPTRLLKAMSSLTFSYYLPNEVSVRPTSFSPDEMYMYSSVMSIDTDGSYGSCIYRSPRDDEKAILIWTVPKRVLTLLDSPYEYYRTEAASVVHQNDYTFALRGMMPSHGIVGAAVVSTLDKCVLGHVLCNYAYTHESVVLCSKVVYGPPPSIEPHNDGVYAMRDDMRANDKYLGAINRRQITDGTSFDINDI